MSRVSSDEFPGYHNVREGAGEAEPDDGGDPNAAVSRRAFLTLSAASAAVVAGCRRPDVELIPYASVPEEQWGHVVPGRPTFYATSLPRPGGAFPVLVESHEGRPTKIEGNPKHPASWGRADAHALATLQDLYSPDRVMNDRRPGVMERGRPRTWADFDLAAPGLIPEGGDGFYVLADGTPSPAVRLVREHLKKKFPQASWHRHDPVDDANTLEGAKIAFGSPLRATYRFDKAAHILALDCDFLGSDPDSVLNSRRFMERRSAGTNAERERMSRLYAVESTYTVTGTMADHRLRLPASQVGMVLIAVAKAAGIPAVKTLPTPAGLPDQWVRAVAEDFVGGVYNFDSLHRTPPLRLVVVGPRQPAWVHALAHAVNSAFDSYGPDGVAEFRDPPPEAGDKPLSSLVADMQAGKVRTLLIVGGNPAFDAPVFKLDGADVRFRDALQKVTHKVRLGLFFDQTSAGCDWHLPLAHPLEGWGDTETSDGTLCCVQPLIAPLNGQSPTPSDPAAVPPRGGRTVLEVLALLTQYAFPGVANVKSKDKDGREVASNPDATTYPIARQKAVELVRASFAARAGIAVTDKAFDARFNAYKQLGFLPDSGRPSKAVKPDGDAVGKAVGEQYNPTAGPSRDSMEVTFHPDYRLGDGRHAMNPLLWEMPDPITKLVWDNAALISPATAAAFGLSTGAEVRLTVGERVIDLPVFVLPGQADWSVALTLGFPGAMPISRVPDGGGFDVYPVRDAAAPHTVTGCALGPTGRGFDLVVTQEHGTIPEGRDIVRETTSETRDTRHETREKDPHATGGHVTEADLKREFQGAYRNPQFRGTPGEKPERFPLDLARPAELDSQFQWGMVIDLSACTGCTACLIACQTENNIPVVGKAEVKRNREMHWIRVDRYFTASADDPRVVSQPVACVHCEAAPCEQVCPVNAAVHSPEGLNLQVYNRCIGTRYCANACPYKVRRFNWFDFNKRGLDELRVPTPLARGGSAFRDQGVPETLRMGKNPDVSVRMRGVMEKCTYCVQRLEAAKYGAKLAATAVAQGRTVIPTEPGETGTLYRKPKDPHAAGYDLDARGRVVVPDGHVQVACQQACPTGAIVFGNALDPASRVSAAKRRAGEYLLLGELNTKPRTSYLPRVRNVNTELATDEHR